MDSIEVLIELLKDRYEEVRKSAIISLGRLGEKYKLPSIIRALKVLNLKNSNLKPQIISALGRIDARSTIEPLIKALADDDWETRRRAVWMLHKKDDPRVLSLVLNQLQDQHISERFAALHSLDVIIINRRLTQEKITSTVDSLCQVFSYSYHDEQSKKAFEILCKLQELTDQNLFLRSLLLTESEVGKTLIQYRYKTMEKTMEMDMEKDLTSITSEEEKLDYLIRKLTYDNRAVKGYIAGLMEELGYIKNEDNFGHLFRKVLEKIREEVHY